MTNPFKREPAAIVAGIIALLTILASFGLGVSPEQQEILKDNLLVILTLILGGGATVRQMVTPNSKVEALKKSDGQVVAGPASTVVAPGEPVIMQPVEVDPGPFPGARR